MPADVIIFVYEVPCIFWHYINVDEVSSITLKKLLQSAMIITNCDSTGVPGVITEQFWFISKGATLSELLLIFKTH